MSDETTPNVPAGVPVAYVPDDDEPVNTPVNNPVTTPSPSPVTEEPRVQKPVVEVPAEDPKQKEWREKIEAARKEKEEAMKPAAETVPASTPAPEVKDDAPVEDAPAPAPTEETKEDTDVDPDLNDILDDTDPDDESLDVKEPSSVKEAEPDKEIKWDKNEEEEPICDIPLGNVVEDMARLTNKYNPFMDENVIRRRLQEDPNDFYVQTMRLFATVGSAVELQRDYLERLLKEGVKLNRNPAGVEDEVLRTKPSDPNKPKVKLTGQEAKLAVLARAKGLRKVHLLNSGFWVILRPMQLTELSQWYNATSMEAREFGKLLGGHSFLFSDVLLKKTFMEILPSIVVDSNLEGWKQPERLAKMISIQDFDTLIWAECTLIYKQGVTVNLHCTNEDCRFIANNVNVDLEKLRFNNLSIMSDEAVAYLAKQLVSLEKVSTAQIKNYQKLLGFTKDIKVGDTVYKARVPSIHRFCEIGSEFVKMVLNSIKGTDNGIDQAVESNVKLNVVKTYLPWIYRIDTPEFETDDTEAIITQMESDVRRTHDLAEAILKYQYDTKISYFCYAMLECPKCHKMPSKDLNDYYPLDPSYLFFFLCSRQLSLMMN